MKKLILIICILFLSGCGIDHTLSERQVALKKMECSLKGLDYEYTFGGLFADKLTHWCITKDNDYKCSYLCEDLFDEISETWGADGANETISDDILTCFNQCLERHKTQSKNEKN